MNTSTNHHYSIGLARRRLLDMKLNHLDLQVSDVSRSAEFFERYFGLCVRSNPGSPALVIMTDEAGFVLVLQRAKLAARYPEGFHLGFLLDDVADVHALHSLAKRDGATVSDVIVNGRGSMVYLTAPDGYYVEVSCQNHKFPPAPRRDSAPAAETGAAPSAQSTKSSD